MDYSSVEKANLKRYLDAEILIGHVVNNYNRVTQIRAEPTHDLKSPTVEYVFQNGETLKEYLCWVVLVESGLGAKSK